jgi:hypothetical protein
VLFTYELQRRLTAAGSSVRAVSAHPGIAKTSLGDHLSGFRGAVAATALRLMAQDAEHGALPTLYAATQDIPGNAFIGPDRFNHLRGHPELVEPTAASQDPGQNESLALGHVAARLVECTFILVGILSVLAMVTLRQCAAGADAGSLVVVGKSLVAVHKWTFLLGPGFVDGLGTGLILGWLMYRSGLVSRRMALFGVVGGPPLAVSGIAVLLGLIPQFSPLQSVATVPEIIWEAFLGLWLTFRGFNRVALNAGEIPDVRAGAGSPVDAAIAA